MRPKKETFFEIKGAESRINCMMRVRDASQRSWGIKYHYHNYIEFLYAVDAECEIWVGEKCHNFLTGDFAVLNSNQPHCIFASKPSKYICVQLTPDILFGADGDSFESGYASPFLLSSLPKTVFKAGELAGVGELSGNIFNEWKKKEYTYGLKIRAYILMIFSKVLTNLKENSLILPEEKLDDTMKKALFYINTNYSTAVEKDVAEICNMSYYHFSHVFKKIIGKSFSEYVGELKIAEGEKLLLATDRSITEIAMDVGFSSASHFISRFKAAKGITPYRFKIKAVELRGKGLE